MSEKLRAGDKIIDPWDRVGIIERVNDDGSFTIDLTSQYWDLKDKVTTNLTAKDLKKLN